MADLDDVWIHTTPTAAEAPAALRQPPDGPPPACAIERSTIAATVTRAAQNPPVLATAADCLGRLTPRELVVFQLLAIGKYNKEVAADLGIALGTAKKHRENLQRKLDCRGRVALVRMALRAAESLPAPAAVATRYDGGTARAVPWSPSDSDSTKR